MPPQDVTPLDCLAVTVNAVDAFVLWEIWRRYQTADAERFDLKWAVVSNAEIADSLPPMTPRQVHLSVKRMEGKRLIDTIPGRNRKTGAAISTWYRLTDTCQKALGFAEAAPKPESKSTLTLPKDPDKAMKAENAWFGPPEAKPKP